MRIGYADVALFADGGVVSRYIAFCMRPVLRSKEPIVFWVIVRGRLW